MGVSSNYKVVCGVRGRAGGQAPLHDSQFEGELRDVRGWIAVLVLHALEDRRERAQHARELRLAGALGRQRVDAVLLDDRFDESRALFGRCALERGELLLRACEVRLEAALVGGALRPWRRPALFAAASTSTVSSGDGVFDEMDDRDERDDPRPPRPRTNVRS